MPLFKPQPQQDSHATSPPASTKSASPTRKGSLFSRRNRSVSPVTQSSYHTSHSDNKPTRGFFGRRSSSSSSLDRHGSVRGDNRRGFFGTHASRDDPSIVSARQKVSDAENAEREADRALSQARAMVKDAKEQVKHLEREAREDALRAKAKQAEAKVVSKSARGLGRHGAGGIF